MTNKNKKNHSERVRAILVISLLILGSTIFPLAGFAGILLMWYWRKWSKLVRIIVSILFIALMIGTILTRNYFSQLGYPIRNITIEKEKYPNIKSSYNVYGLFSTTP